jgi:uncharacterized delta-60 repeat protein
MKAGGHPERRARRTIALAVIAASAALSAGAPGTAFAANGTVLPAVFGLDESGEDVAVQADGKLILVGSANAVGSNRDVALMRLTTSGTLDPTFGGDGIVTTAVAPGAGSDQALGVALEPDGQIVIAGQSDVTGTGSPQFLVARYNTDGALDTGFGGGDGITTVAASPPSSGVAVARDVLIEPDGQIVIAGNATIGAAQNAAVLRFNSDGTLDSAFDGDSATGNGMVLFDGGGNGVDRLESLALQSDGKIVVVGQANPGTGGGIDYLTARLSGIDGTLDDGAGAWSGDGIATLAIASGTGRDSAESVAIQGDGKLVVAGASTQPSQDFSFARFNTDGTLDDTFDGPGGAADGAFRVPIDASAFDTAERMALQADGKIVAAGSVEVSGEQDFAAMRLNTSGTLDNASDADPGTTFDGDGIATVSVSDIGDAGNSLALLSGGDVLLVGRSTIDGTDRFTGALLGPAGALVTSFNADASAPDTAFSGGVADGGVTADATPTFSFTSETGATFACWIDSTSEDDVESCDGFNGPTGSETTDTLADGVHTIQVRARDAAGLADPTPALRTFTVDTLPPDTAVTSGPSAKTRDRTPSFRFAAPGSPGSETFECKVDGGAYAACTSPTTTKRLPPGRHTFRVRATDQAGLVDASPARRSFKIVR